LTGRTCFAYVKIYFLAASVARQKQANPLRDTAACLFVFKIWQFARS